MNTMLFNLALYMVGAPGLIIALLFKVTLSRRFHTFCCSPSSMLLLCVQCWMAQKVLSGAHPNPKSRTLRNPAFPVCSRHFSSIGAGEAGFEIAGDLWRTPPYSNCQDFELDTATREHLTCSAGPANQIDRLITAFTWSYDGLTNTNQRPHFGSLLYHHLIHQHALLLSEQDF